MSLLRVGWHDPCYARASGRVARGYKCVEVDRYLRLRDAGLEIGSMKLEIWVTGREAECAITKA
jgi:hypothetical protein